MKGNLRVIPQAWLDGERRRGGALWTDGRTIYSYGLVIGYTATDGRRVAISNASGSMTTSAHRNAAIRYANATVVLPGHERSQCGGSQCRHIRDAEPVAALSG